MWQGLAVDGSVAWTKLFPLQQHCWCCRDPSPDLPPRCLLHTWSAWTLLPHPAQKQTPPPLQLDDEEMKPALMTGSAPHPAASPEPSQLARPPPIAPRDLPGSSLQAKPIQLIPPKAAATTRSRALAAPPPSGLRASQQEMAPCQRLETHQTSLCTLTQLSPISVAAQDAFPRLIAPSSRATCISCPVVAAGIARCPLPGGAEVRSQTQGHVRDLASQEAKWNTTEPTGRRKGNSFRDPEHLVRSKDA